MNLALVDQAKNINSAMANYHKVQVVVGVVINSRGKVLVALRPEHVHQSGLWEFPGGKIEAGELPLQALQRELSEEVGIDVLTAEPLTQLDYAYEDKSVFLDVWRVLSFNGEAHGKEGQQIDWVLPSELVKLAVPAANYPIVETVVQICRGL